ncbi:MAG: hypothetical protein ACXV8U_16700 [Methylobacter sp.]
MLKILISLVIGLIITGMTMTGSKSLSIDTFLNGFKAFNQARLNDQSNQVVPKLETTPEEKKQIETMKRIRDNMIESQKHRQ